MVPVCEESGAWVTSRESENIGKDLKGSRNGFSESGLNAVWQVLIIA